MASRKVNKYSVRVCDSVIVSDVLLSYARVIYDSAMATQKALFDSGAIAALEPVLITLDEE